MVAHHHPGEGQERDWHQSELATTRQLLPGRRQGVVKVQLQTGQEYTYLASDEKKSRKGTILASCTPNSCEAIELK